MDTLHCMHPQICQQMKRRKFPSPKPLGIHCLNHVGCDIVVSLRRTSMRRPTSSWNSFKVCFACLFFFRHPDAEKTFLGLTNSYPFHFLTFFSLLVTLPLATTLSRTAFFALSTVGKAVSTLQFSWVKTLLPTLSFYSVFLYIVHYRRAVKFAFETNLQCD